GLSGAVSFDPAATADADAFIRDRLLPRFGASPPSRTGARRTPAPAADTDGDPAPLAVIATDGELYGHHQQFRDLFLQRLLAPPSDPDPADGAFDIVTVADVVADLADGEAPPVRIAERTSWSCHHGVARWSGECSD